MLALATSSLTQERAFGILHASPLSPPDAYAVLKWAAKRGDADVASAAVEALRPPYRPLHKKQAFALITSLLPVCPPSELLANLSLSDWGRAVRARGAVISWFSAPANEDDAFEQLLKLPELVDAAAADASGAAADFCVGIFSSSLAALRNCFVLKQVTKSSKAIRAFFKDVSDISISLLYRRAFVPCGDTELEEAFWLENFNNEMVLAKTNIRDATAVAAALLKFGTRADSAEAWSAVLSLDARVITENSELATKISTKHAHTMQTKLFKAFADVRRSAQFYECCGSTHVDMSVVSEIFTRLQMTSRDLVELHAKMPASHRAAFESFVVVDEYNIDALCDLENVSEDFKSFTTQFRDGIRPAEAAPPRKRRRLEDEGWEEDLELRAEVEVLPHTEWDKYPVGYLPARAFKNATAENAELAYIVSPHCAPVVKGCLLTSPDVYDALLIYKRYDVLRCAQLDPHELAKSLVRVKFVPVEGVDWSPIEYVLKNAPSHPFIQAAFGDPSPDRAFDRRPDDLVHFGLLLNRHCVNKKCLERLVSLYTHDMHTFVEAALATGTRSLPYSVRDALLRVVLEDTTIDVYDILKCDAFYRGIDSKTLVKLLAAPRAHTHEILYMAAAHHRPALSNAFGFFSYLLKQTARTADVSRTLRAASGPDFRPHAAWLCLCLLNDGTSPKENILTLLELLKKPQLETLKTLARNGDALDALLKETARK